MSTKRVVKEEYPNFDFSFIDGISQKRNRWQLPWPCFYLNRNLIRFLPLSAIGFLHRMILYPYTHSYVDDKESRVFLNNLGIFCQELEKIIKDNKFN